MGKECNQICVFAYVFPMQHFAWLRTAEHRESRGFWIALAPVWVPVRAPVSVPAGDAAPGSAVPICAQHFCFLGWYPGSSCPLGVCHRTMRLRHCAEVLTCVCVFISRWQCAAARSHLLLALGFSWYLQHKDRCKRDNTGGKTLVKKLLS